ncbi:AMSH-like ubiquitin thioesterase 3 [Aristolochia californica]|uniref:AMSH-like ubiquitin thioesterase 3 n=1 Tax=Aristolochia californica TaxID=171875 RepID=UPI0035D5BB21
METTRPMGRMIDINAFAQKIEVDNRIPLHFYYRIAANLLKQANIYREEKNLIDLYIILLRFSSLVSETIPFHRDYQVLLPKQRISLKKKLLDAVNELEHLKPDVQRQVNDLNNRNMVELDRWEGISSNSIHSLEWPSVQKQSFSEPNKKQLLPGTRVSGPQDARASSSRSLQVEQQFQKLSLGLPPPKDETLSRHSILGPSGLRGQWLGPVSGTRVNYPSNVDVSPTVTASQNQGEHYGPLAAINCDSGGDGSSMESVLSLDDGRWSSPRKDSSSFSLDVTRNNAQFNIVRQPSPPPVLAHVQQDVLQIPPSRVADPRPGPAPSENGLDSKTFQHLHITPKLMEDFLRLAQTNTAKNLETCGVLAGALKNRIFYVTTLIIPKQESTSDSCQTTNEEEIFDVQDKLSLFQIGWIHTHPTQTCFMSSIDLHTHYSYQVMLPEAIAIVMAPTDTSRTHGIFHLSDPGGVSLIRNCQQRGFHPHEEPLDGSPIYEHCSHVFMNTKLKFDVVDLR